MSGDEPDDAFLAELAEQFRPAPLGAERARALRQRARGAAERTRWVHLRRLRLRPALALPAAALAAGAALLLLARAPAPAAPELAAWEDEVLGAGAPDLEDVGEDWARIELPADYEDLSQLVFE